MKQMPFPSFKESAARGKKICMISYNAEPSYIPNMYNAGLYFAKAGCEVESIHISVEPGQRGRESFTDGFMAMRFFLATRYFFHSKYGLAPSNIVIAGLQYFFSYAEFIIKAAWWGWKSRADLYEAHDLPALLPALVASKLRRVPIVYHAHELYSEMHSRVRFAGFWRGLERLLVPFVTQIVTPEINRSHIYVTEFGRNIEPLTIKNCPRYRHPIRTSKIREYLAAKQIECSTIVLYQGLFDTSRCIQELILATEFFNEGIILVLIGSGFKDWQDPETRIGNAKRVVLMPRVPYDELFAYTASADIGVLFYRNDCRNNYYCAPNKVHEFMMMGLPVVTCDYPGIKSIVEREEVGICVNPENPLEIARAINSLSEDRQLYERMQRNGLVLSLEKYNWEVEFAKLSDYYDELFRSNRRNDGSGRDRTGHGSGMRTQRNSVTEAS